MKHRTLLVFGLAGVLLVTSCGSKNDLYKQTDFFVEQLSSTYQSYGLQGLSEKRTTKDGEYSVAPVGRLIIVKIEEYVPDEKYDALKKALERHYRNDRRVNRVYINQAGTIVIDCRN